MTEHAPNPETTPPGEAGAITALTRFAIRLPWAVWPTQILALAASYFISGKLGLLLAIPPGYATAVWPPSGIALAGLLLFGYRAWPGIVLGSFLVNVGTSFDASTLTTILKTLAIAAGIGTGAALQALAGAWLIRRFVGYPNALDRERDIGWFFLLGGPVSCLVNSIAGVSTLWAHGIIPASSYFFSWWTWWVGDVIGVLIFTPLILIFTAAPRPAWRARRLSVALPLMASFVLAVLVFVLVSGQEQRRIEAEFARRAHAMAEGLNNALGDYEQALHAIESFYTSSSRVERHEFGNYVRHLLSHYPGIQALSWNPRVTAGERAAYETKARADGFHDFRFTELDAQGRIQPAAAREEYVPVYFIQPYAGNESVLGFDVASDPQRREALERARVSGEPVVTGRLRLVQEAEAQAGFLLVLPLYANDTLPDTPAARGQQLRGYAVGAFRVKDMVDAVLKRVDGRGLNLRIEDDTAGVGERELYGTSVKGPYDEADEGLSWRTTLSFAQRQWTLYFTPTPDYLASQRSWAAWLVLAAGLLFTALLGAFLLILTGRARRIEQVVAERTEELKRSNRELEQFAYVASHDLQEPLRMVSSYVQLLAKRYRDKLDSDANEFIEFAVDGATRMQRLIQDLLAYSRVGTRGQTLVDCDLETALTWACTNLQAAIEESQAQITHDPLPWVVGDAAQLGQLMQNLIANALKFRGREAPCIHVSARRHGALWQVGVQDNGIGIDPAYFEQIFVIFQRLHTREQYAGTGIGLAICKKIVERHGGRIWVESAPGQGTTFYFTLPAAQIPGAA